MISSPLIAGVSRPEDRNRARRDFDLMRDHGKARCRVCERVGPVDQALVVLLGALPVYAICQGCAEQHAVHVEPTADGICVHHTQHHPYQLDLSSP